MVANSGSTITLTVARLRSAQEIAIRKDLVMQYLTASASEMILRPKPSSTSGAAGELRIYNRLHQSGLEPFR
jgi:hypothetical protein